MDTKNKGFNTRMIHAGHYEDCYGSATVPIYQTSTFAFKNAKHGASLFAGEENGYIYTRIANPTIQALEENVSALENGAGGIATSSGMGAVSTIYMALLEQGDHMISTDSVYGPSRGIMEKYFSRYGVESTYLDTSDLDTIKAAIKPNSRILYLETPANPTIQLSDIKACCELAHQHNMLVVIDNTFSSPYLQNPIEMGADIVFHSITKFLNGHADLVGGVIVPRTRELYTTLRHAMVNLGFNMDPHQAYLAIRGIKTLSLRVEKAQANAKIVAEWLEGRKEVEWIKYPGLKSHPQYELALKQMRGPGAMISFGLKGGFEAGEKVMNHVKLATLAVSLGGVETLIQHPASMTHASLSREKRLKANISDGLVRLSVGIEDVEDLLNDLEQALSHI